MDTLLLANLVIRPWGIFLGGDLLYAMTAIVRSMNGEMAEHELGPCENCNGEVPVSAVQCTHCGYHIPEGSRVTDLLHLIAGNLLTITVIGAIVGLPLMWRALQRMEKRSKRTIVCQQAESSGDA